VVKKQLKKKKKGEVVSELNEFVVVVAAASFSFQMILLLLLLLLLLLSRMMHACVIKGMLMWVPFFVDRHAANLLLHCTLPPHLLCLLACLPACLHILHIMLRFARNLYL
jgi:hypothetical protein